jgi:hypothetical protein
MDQLERFKTAIERRVFSGNCGYEPRAARSRQIRPASFGSVVLKNSATGDKIVVRSDTDGHWIYFTVRDDSENRTVIAFCLRRGRLDNREALGSDVHLVENTTRVGHHAFTYRSALGAAVASRTIWTSLTLLRTYQGDTKRPRRPRGLTAQ